MTIISNVLLTPQRITTAWSGSDPEQLQLTCP